MTQASFNLPPGCLPSDIDPNETWSDEERLEQELNDGDDRRDRSYE